MMGIPLLKPGWETISVAVTPWMGVVVVVTMNVPAALSAMQPTASFGMPPAQAGTRPRPCDIILQRYLSPEAVLTTWKQACNRSV